MGFIRGIPLIRGITLYIILNAFHILHIAGEKVTLENGKCKGYFGQTIAELPKINVPVWSPDSSKGTCYICNPTNTKKSWFTTRLIQAKGHKFIAFDVQAGKTTCANCKNQDINVYILYGNSHHDLSPDKLIKIFNKLPLLKTLDLSNANQTKEWYHFQIEAIKNSTFSLLFLSQGSCTTIYEFLISSFVCEPTVASGLVLPQTVSPGHGEELRVNVSCPEHTINPGNDKPYGLCSSQGIWEAVSPCICMKGFTSASEWGCKDCRQTMTGPSGSFRSHQPAISKMNPHSQYCYWLITFAEKYVISLSFKNLTVPVCDDASITIYDGLNDTAPSLGKYCGLNASTEVKVLSSTNKLFIVANFRSYQSDSTSIFNFDAQYNAENSTGFHSSSSTVRLTVSLVVITILISLMHGI